MLLQKSPDFDSAMRRFESSRPSQRKRPKDSAVQDKGQIGPRASGHKQALDRSRQ